MPYLCFNTRIAVFTVIFLHLTFTSAAQQTSAQLNAKPVIIKGANLPLLNIYKPHDLVGFRYAGKWEQIIIQIDEMKEVNGAQIYNNAGMMKTANPRDSWDGMINIEYDYNGKTGGKNSFLVYADANTFTGADQNDLFDSNDELVFMARDGGDIPPDNDLFPAGVDNCSGVQIRNADPNSGTVSYVYIFKRDNSYLSPVTKTSLQQDAGLPHPVSYNFKFRRNGAIRGTADYKEFYNRQFGPNPETSTVTTPHYTKGFGDRWIENSLVITTPASPGLLEPARINMLDGHKLTLMPLKITDPRHCNRTEYTFSGTMSDKQVPRLPDGTAETSTKGYEGAFIANINGPLRAIRSYMGTNSGPLTQRDNICYDRMEVINTYLRVHSVDGIMDYYDYAPAAGNMIYNNNNNMPNTAQTLNGHTYTGVLIDGKPDVTQPGVLNWEMVNSLSGAIFRYNKINNTDDVPDMREFAYYYDNAAPDAAEPQCTGDGVSWGAGGMMVKRVNKQGNFIELPNTEVRFAGEVAQLSLVQYNIYLQPETQLAERTAWIDMIDKNVEITASAWQQSDDCESRKVVSADVYPNPSNGNFVLRVGGSPYQNIKVTLFDMQGRQIFRTIKKGQLSEPINLSGLTSQGVYLMQLNIDGKKVNKKVIVK